MIDVEAEIVKCEKKLGLANLNAEKTRKILSQPENLPEAVRTTNEEKVRTKSSITRKISSSRSDYYSS